MFGLYPRVEGTEEGESRLLEELKKDKVKLLSSTRCHYQQWGWCWIVFSLKKADLVEGLKRIMRAIRVVSGLEFNSGQKHKAKERDQMKNTKTNQESLKSKPKVVHTRSLRRRRRKMVLKATNLGKRKENE